MIHETCFKSKSPAPPHPPQSDNLADMFVPGQVGGGCRRPSPPTIETPTCLRARVKPTVRDTGLVQQAEHRRAHLADPPVVEPRLQAPTDVTSLVNDQDAPPLTIAHSNAEPSFMTTLQPPIDSSLASRRSTPSSNTTGSSVQEDVLTAREPQLNIPVTRIIPPTPINSNSSAVGGDCTEAGSLFPDQIKPVTPTAGCRTTFINSILKQGYNDLENTLTQLVDKTSLTPQQIMDGWHKSKGRAINGINHWNLYTKYFAKHEAQEQRRLVIPADVLSKSTYFYFAIYLF